MAALTLRLVKNPHLHFIVFGVILALLPSAGPVLGLKTSTLQTIGFMLIYSIVALGLNLLLGYSGLISLGTAGFMGLGAYLAAYFQDDLGLGFWLAILAALVIPTLIGLVVGVISLRVRSIYLAIATLCISEILLKTFEQVEWFTRGTAGKQSRYPTITGTQLDRSAVFILIVIVLVIIMMLTYNMVHGQMGRALHAMRSSEVAAQAMGINILKYKLFAFSVATLYAGLGGALYLFFLRSSYPTTWNLFLSLNLIAVVVVGGLRSIYGTIAGAFIIYAVPELYLKELPVIGDVAGLPYIFSGVLIILVIMFFPSGITGLADGVRGLVNKAQQARKNAAAERRPELVVRTAVGVGADRAGMVRGESVRGELGQGVSGPGEPGRGVSGPGEPRPGELGRGVSGRGVSGPGESGQGESGQDEPRPGELGRGVSGRGVSGPGEPGPGEPGGIDLGRTRDSLWDPVPPDVRDTGQARS